MFVLNIYSISIFNISFLLKGDSNYTKNNVQKNIDDKELADMNYKIANEKFKQKKLTIY